MRVKIFKKGSNFEQARYRELRAGRDCQITVDVGNQEIASTSVRPDLVLWS